MEFIYLEKTKKEALLDVSKEVSLEINSDKTK
jgi:hypothetical protein